MSVCYRSTDILNLSVYICICIEEIFIGIFLRSSHEKLRKRFFAYIFNGKFYEMKNYSILRCVVTMCKCVCVSVCAVCALRYFLGSLSWHDDLVSDQCSRGFDSV